MPTINLAVTTEQAEFIDHPASMKVITCGRRWGKTFSALSYLVKCALTNKKSESSYVGKTYKLAYKMFRKISSQKSLDPYIKNRKQQPSPHIEWKNGHVTWFFSGDRPDNLRGDGLVLCIVDEAAHMIERLIMEVLMPTMLDQGGTIVLLSTFRGRNWYYDWHQKGVTYPNDDDCKSWLKPTSSSCWAQGPGGRIRLTRMQSRLPESVWQQECECVVDANQAAVFGYERVEACSKGFKRGPQANMGYVLAYDSGKKADPAAIVILECQYTTEACAVVHAEDINLDTPYTKQVERVVELARMYNASVMVDSTGAGTKDAIVDFLKKAAPELQIHGVMLRADAQMNMVKYATKHFEDGLISIPREFHNLLFQLKQFEYEYTQNGKYRYQAPEGEHDDNVFALLMALEGKKKKLFRITTSVAPRPAPGSQGDVFYKQRHRIEETTERL